MQRDIVLRWIAQIAAIVARILRRDPTLSLEMARHYLEDAEAQVLGVLAELVPKLDPESAARLLDDANRIYGYAQTLALRSALAAAAGAQAEASSLAARAVAIGREAVRRVDPPPEEWLEWLDAAQSQLDGTALTRAAAPDRPRSEP